MTKDEAGALYSLIAGMKSDKLSRDAQIKYIPVRMKLRAIVDEFEKFRSEVVEQNKPKDYETEDKKAEEELVKKVEPILREYLKQECDIDTKIFSIDEAIDLIESNPGMVGGESDLILKYLLKD